MGKKKKTPFLIDESIVVKESPFEDEVMAPRRKKVHYKVRLKCKNQKQKEFIKQNKSKATNETETNFLKATLSYLDALKNSCEKLSAVADFKQKLLEKKIKRDVFAFNKILKEYEQAQTDLVRAGAFVRIHWGELKMQESNG